jgi:carbon monoxide dehydrogenase subunit G
MIHFETTVQIARPREAVFAYVAEPSRFAAWNSAVERVTPLAGRRFTMQRVLPAGRATNELEVAARAPEELTLRTVSGPTPFVYRYTFSATDAGTLITLRADVQLAGAAAALGPLAARAVKRGVDANLGALRDILEGRSAP